LQATEPRETIETNRKKKRYRMAKGTRGKKRKSLKDKQGTKSECQLRRGEWGKGPGKKVGLS